MAQQGTRNNEGAMLPQIAVPGSWDKLFQGGTKTEFEALLPQILPTRRWFGGKGRPIKNVSIQDAVPVSHEGGSSFLSFVRVEYVDGSSERYVLALSFASGVAAESLLHQEKSPALLRVDADGNRGVVYDAVRDRAFVLALLDLLSRDEGGSAGPIKAHRTDRFPELRGAQDTVLEPRVVSSEQSNSSVIFGDRLILKLFRRLEEGVNPDFEIGQFLTEHGFPHSPPVAAALELRTGASEPITVAILQGFVPNRGDAWNYTMDVLQNTLARVLPLGDTLADLPLPESGVELPPALIDISNGYFDSVRLLGQRTAELHLSLDSKSEDPNFSPEPLSPSYQQSVHDGMRRLALSVLSLLRSQALKLGPVEQKLAGSILDAQPELLDAFSAILDGDLRGERIRIHGDYHLGQVLFTGNDFVLIDFEGEPLRSLQERRIKRLPLQDVAGMIRSFDYAGQAALLQFPHPADVRKNESLHAFVESWTTWVSSVFLRSYLETAGAAPFLPPQPEKRRGLLDAFCLEKAIYELGYEINNRPTWVRIPLNGIWRILSQQLRNTGRRGA